MPEKIVLVGSASKGEIRTLYHPDVVSIFQESGREITSKRVSHIEVEEDAKGNFIGFYVDLTPVNGPVTKGFKTRQEALEHEHAWLIANNIPFPTNTTTKS